MDCNEFNELITKYASNKLSKKQELEFLQHKDSCCDCNVVFDLISEQDDLCGISFNFDEIYDGTLSLSVMDRIQTIEHSGYNFKINNFLNIAFFTVFAMASLIIFKEFRLFKLVNYTMMMILNCKIIVENILIVLKDLIFCVITMYYNMMPDIIAVFLLVVFIKIIFSTKNNTVE